MPVHRSNYAGDVNLACSPDGQWIAGHATGFIELYIWRADTGRHVVTLRRHRNRDISGQFHQLQFSPDSKQIVAVAHSGMVVWDLSRFIP
jgi:hypothetical protein